MISCHLISDLPHIYALLGHISVSVESYRSSYSYMSAPRWGRARYFIMIPQWSLSWATQSSCSTFICHHASYSGRCFLEVWVRFGLQGSHISCYPIFDLPYIWCYTGAYSISDEIYGSSWSRTIISAYGIHTETRTYSLFYCDPPVEPFLSRLS